MKISPLSKPMKPRRVALVVPHLGSLTLYTLEGERLLTGPEIPRGLEPLKGAHIYCAGPLTRLRFCCDARWWTAHTWRRAASTMEIAGVSIHPLRGTLDESPDPFEDLLEFLGWAQDYGVAAASLPTMAANLLRASLSSPIVPHSDPAVTKPAFYGGRQQAAPGVYKRPTVSYDLAAAYPAAMTSEPYCLALVESRPGRHLFTPGIQGVARATVKIPADLQWSPLPYRVAEEVVIWPHGDVEGTWTLGELALAHGLGCKVEISRAWVGRKPARFLDRWWAMMQEARALPGQAGKLGKIASNLLWGGWAMDGWRGRWTWPTHTGTTPARCLEETEPLKLPHATLRHLAVETTARVRVKLLDEGLLNYPEALHVDTDGVIVDAGAPAPTGEGWRVKRTHDDLDVRAPQVYRYRTGGGRWTYVAAGMSAEQAAHWWKTPAVDGVLSVSIAGAPVSLSPMSARRLRAAPPPPIADRFLQVAAERARLSALEPRHLFAGGVRRHTDTPRRDHGRV